MAKVSIVIPFYNNKELLMEMVDSILTQSFKDWELLLINDGADTETIETVYHYEKSDDRIKIINRDRLPKGVQTCRNIGLENASGELVCIFDSDDLLLPHCLGNRVKYLDDNQDLDFAVFRAHTYDITNKSRVQILGAKGTSDDIKYFINGALPFAVWTNIYRRQSLLRSHATWDENIMSLQDTDFNIQNIVVNKMKYSYYEGKEPDYLWRINHNKNSITKKIRSKEYNKSHLYFISKIIRVIRANYGNRYDSDIALRIFDFSIKFSENNDLESLRLLQKIGQVNKIDFVDLGRINIYTYLKRIFPSGIIDKILRLVIFPKQTYQHHCNVKRFLAETEVL